MSLRTKPRAGAFGLAVVALLSSACRRSPADSTPPTLSLPTPERVGLSAAEREEFYHLEEGSEVFPLDWFLALESETGEGLFAERLDRFGFLPEAASEARPHGLPVGITAADTRDLRFLGVKMVGVNCAACHVSELEYQGRRVRLDGASGRADISAFYSALARSALATVQDPLRFLRFIDRVRGRATNPLLAAPEADRSARVFRAVPDFGPAGMESGFDRELRRELIQLIQQEEQRPPLDIAANLTVKPGPGLDRAVRAVQADLTAGVSPQAVARRVPSQPLTRSSALADVAPPEAVRNSFVPAFLKDTILTFRLLKARVAFLATIARQMNVQTTTPGFGRLDAFGGARNLLFAGGAQASTAPVSFPHLWNFERLKWVHWDANTTSVLERNIGQALGLGAVFDRTTMTSTVSLVNLHRLEQLAKKIRPPRWEEIFGPIDPDAASRGAALFHAHCARCHAPAGIEDHLLDLAAIGTDPNRATNFAAPVGATPNDRAIAELVGRVKRRAYDEEGFTPEQQATLEGGRPALWRVTAKYAVRPLIAVWATAPYLHNNSVPSLEDLLLPPDQRPASFFVGSAEYDARKLGYVTDQRAGSFRFDTRTPGNANGGHLYGTGLSAAERADLLEYLKRF